jgi:hypothetical protein
MVGAKLKLTERRIMAEIKATRMARKDTME